MSEKQEWETAKIINLSLKSQMTHLQRYYSVCLLKKNRICVFQASLLGFSKWSEIKEYKYISNTLFWGYSASSSSQGGLGWHSKRRVASKSVSENIFHSVIIDLKSISKNVFIQICPCKQMWMKCLFCVRYIVGITV